MCQGCGIGRSCDGPIFSYSLRRPLARQLQTYGLLPHVLAWKDVRPDPCSKASKRSGFC